jgi:pimeloyl-ACP methyl ester carboxylesterase
MQIRRWRSAAVGLAAAIGCSGALALTCGANNGWTCQGTASQYAGGFSPGVGYGGFGGASACTATKTPVVFLHGNGDTAISWDMPPGAVSGYATPPASVYAEFKAAGYKDCEQFGVTYLSSSENAAPQYNYHQPSKYAVINTFIDKVLAYTGATKVDIVAHSLGSSMALAALDTGSRYGKVRRFINISGGLRGIQSCLYTGAANPYATTCGSENWVDSRVFGFYPGGWSVSYYNLWTGSGAGSLRAEPALAPAVSFYTIAAGAYDQVGCSSLTYWSGCDLMARFDNATNVKAQLMIGTGATAGTVDWNWKDGSPYLVGGGDSSNGIGHFRSKTNAGKIIVRMLTTTCTTGCATGYAGVYGPAANL